MRIAANSAGSDEKSNIVLVLMDNSAGAKSVCTVAANCAERRHQLTAAGRRETDKAIGYRLKAARNSVKS